MIYTFRTPSDQRREIYKRKWLFEDNNQIIHWDAVDQPNGNIKYVRTGFFRRSPNGLTTPVLAL